MRFEIQGDGDIEAEKGGREGKKKEKKINYSKKKRKENRGGPSVVPTIQN